MKDLTLTVERTNNHLVIKVAHGTLAVAECGLPLPFISDDPPPFDVVELARVLLRAFIDDYLDRAEAAP